VQSVAANHASAQEGGVDPREAHEAQELIRRCLAGEETAIRSFQGCYGELIYGYPLRVFGTPAEDAADFYVYAFDEGRIFRRMRTFAGRAPLRAYLLSYVLDHLVIDWKRRERELETVPLDTLGQMPDQTPPPRSTEVPPLRELLAGIEPEKAVVMKLLYVEDWEIQPSEIRYLARASKRTVADVLSGIDRLRATVRDREARLKSIEDALDAVQAWISVYERRLQRINTELNTLPRGGVAERLSATRAEIERKITRRQQQRAKLIAQTQRRKVTAPYKDIATLLNTTVGNVASQIARVRQQLKEQGTHDDN